MTPDVAEGSALLKERVTFALFDRAARTVKFLLPIAALLLVWEGAVRAGLAESNILPAPSMVIARAIELLDVTNPAGGMLLTHIATSLYRALSAFAFAVLVAIPLGFLLGLSGTVYRWVSPVISLLLPLPAVAWTPILLVAFGQGDVTIITVCFLGAVFPVLYSTIQGVRSVSRQSVWVVRSMGANFGDIFVRVMLPATLPALMSGLKLGMAHAWRTLVAAEMLAALSSGLGYMIFAARSYMDVPTMFVGIVCLAVIGMLIEHFLFVPLENATTRKWEGAIHVGGRR
ncbi:ABC transporter permease [Mongoliimonas terrestris]|uniref:ABC transporter permease n=1 Tax=Mongoliimonas terrestris TaxID=1709001 RepID=UPI0009498C41|nr:ABC transporter permease [Mongoliimonas terrestris]